jgi:Leucine-rich repeat (LRR) protein
MPLLEYLQDPLGGISDLMPLSFCKNLKYLDLNCSSVTDISPLLSLSMLEDLSLARLDGYPSIKELSPLSHCKKLKTLDIASNNDITDLSRLIHCPDLQYLDLTGLSQLEDLQPLTKFQSLEVLFILGITNASVLPLARCYNLARKTIQHSADENKDLAELMEMRPDIEYSEM